MIDERSTVLLKKIVQTDGYVSLNYLTETLGVSRRTLYYDIQKINNWLEDHQLEPIYRKARQGFYLEKTTKQQVNTLINDTDDRYYYYTRLERQLLLSIEVLASEKKVYVKELAELVNVSRGTIISDLKGLKEIFKTEFSLHLTFDRANGYRVDGREFNQRKALTNCLEQLRINWDWDAILTKFPMLSLNSNNGLSITNNQAFSMLVDGEEELGIELTDEMLELLSLQLLIVIYRVQGDRIVAIDDEEKQVLEKTKEYQVAISIAKKLEQQEEIRIPIDEIFFITIHLLGSKVNKLNTEMDKSQEMQQLKQVISLMVNDFENYACVLFKEKSELEKKMYMHLKPAYYRMKYGVGTSNELSDSIPEQYPEIFQLTKKVIGHLERLLQQPVNQSELAYIAIFFGGWLKREGKNPLPRTRALIICENGIGTSTILRGQLEHLLSTVDIVDNISFRQYKRNKYEDVDVIFTTSPIKETGIPVIMLNPILTDAEKELLITRFNAFKSKRDPAATSVPKMMEVIRRYADIKQEQDLKVELERIILETNSIVPKEYQKPMLNQLLTNQMIQIVPSVKDWEEGIWLASNPLLEKDYINDEYVKSMIENIKSLGPYVVIAPKIAIPHSRPEHGVNRLGMSLLVVEEGVNFSEEEKHKVNLIIVLAAIDNETHLKALSQLTELLSDEDSLNKLLTIKLPAEGEEIINQFSYA